MTAPNSEGMSLLRQVGQNNADGVNMGTGSTDYIAFYGTTPIVQRSGTCQSTQATSGFYLTNSSPWGFASPTVLCPLYALIIEMRATLIALGLMKGS